MPYSGVLCFLNAKERRLLDEIERRTGAEVRLDPLEIFSKSMWLVSAKPKYDEDGDRVAPDKLSYIADVPQKEILSPEQLAAYPPEIRDALTNDAGDPDSIVSCNILPTYTSGEDYTAILREMLEYTTLLKMGWHLGREDDFQDPFEYPPPPPVSEEDLLWADYLESQAADEESPPDES